MARCLGWVSLVDITGSLESTLDEAKKLLKDVGLEETCAVPIDCASGLGPAITYFLWDGTLYIDQETFTAGPSALAETLLTHYLQTHIFEAPLSEKALKFLLYKLLQRGKVT